MKKILLFIAWLFLIWNTLAYDVIIYDNNNNLLFMYPVEEWITEITLDWDWVKDWNDYTFNWWFTWLTVNYIDWYWDNQSIETDLDLYLNWDLSLWYTWEQYLSLTDNSCWVFSWFTPVFDITWSIDVSSWENVFNNFWDNALKVLLSNIPSYIQYITIFFILLFLFWFVRRFKKRK